MARPDLVDVDPARDEGQGGAGGATADPGGVSQLGARDQRRRRALLVTQLSVGVHLGHAFDAGNHKQLAEDGGRDRRETALAGSDRHLAVGSMVGADQGDELLHQGGLGDGCVVDVLERTPGGARLR
ncbi:MAG TPA: hypothetical protein VHT30_04485 [Acidimicrobiales bacterium]|nr:hypothetical protein [Acidimicrobiales bacterium]